MATLSVEEMVRARLAEAGFSLTEEQTAIFIEAYPLIRAEADSLFAVPEVRYEQPAPIFRAA